MKIEYVKNINRRFCLLIVAVLSFFTEISASTLTELRVEMQENPVGVGTLIPRFSWQISTRKGEVMQKAYQIMVAETEKGLKNASLAVWQSGKVYSDQSVLVKYAGKPLESGKRYFWQVKVWTNQGEECISRIQHWDMALLKPSDWKGKWIGLDNEKITEDECWRTTIPARYLRKEFRVNAPVKRAMLYVCGLGSSYFYINGQVISDDVFGPLPTLYDKTAMYLTYDVTKLLVEGVNVIGGALGNGRYCGLRGISYPLHFGLPTLIVQLVIENDAGELVVVSDETWKVTNKGPIRANNEFDGEIYDARMELGDWTKRGYDDSQWQKADIMSAPTQKLCAQTSPCIKVMEEIVPISVKRVDKNRCIIDMGQNMVGWLKVSLKGKEGQPVTLRFAETLQADGNELYVANLRTAKSTDVYIPERDGSFKWEPLFVYHGFRFVEVSGLDYTPSVSDFTGKIIYDRMKTIGSFECSNALLNQIYTNAYWGIRGNYRGMPTDCPQRDERMGWLGDRTTGAHGESFIFDNALLYNKWLMDIQQSITPEGVICDVSPCYWKIYEDDVTWPAAYFYIADMLHTQFGDDAAIRIHYSEMKNWVERVSRVLMKDYIVLRDNFGDWCMPPESLELIHSQDTTRHTKGEVLSTTMFYSILQLMKKFADINRFPDDAARYTELAIKIKDAYNRAFFDTANGWYSNNTVTANILSLRLSLVPAGYEMKVFENIVKKTENDCNSHVSTGVVGIQHLLRGLTEYGKADLAYTIATNDTYPSWGYMAKNGATTIWELWNGNTADPAMNSGNHVMLLGDLVIWLYEKLAGIKNAPSSIGFKKILMQPVFPKGLDHVKASYHSPYGMIHSEWKRKHDKLQWSIVIPANSCAKIVVPAHFKMKIGKNGSKKKYKIHEVNGNITMELTAGRYTLVSE